MLNGPSNALPACDQLTATTAATQMPAGSAGEVLLQADPANTANILVGNSSKQKIVLTAGSSITIAVTDLSLLWYVAVSGSQLLNYLSRN